MNNQIYDAITNLRSEIRSNMTLPLLKKDNLTSQMSQDQVQNLLWRIRWNYIMSLWPWHWSQIEGFKLLTIFVIYSRLLSVTCLNIQNTTLLELSCYFWTDDRTVFRLLKNNIEVFVGNILFTICWQHFAIVFLICQL